MHSPESELITSFEDLIDKTEETVQAVASDAIHASARALKLTVYLMSETHDETAKLHKTLGKNLLYDSSLSPLEYLRGLRSGKEEQD